MAIINNVAYSWSMITLASTALGIEEGSTVLEGVSGIKWSKKRKIEPNYGLGGKPVSRGFGNISYTASITMDYATQQTLRSTYGSLMDIGEFDLIISFTNPMASDDWTTTTAWRASRTIPILRTSSTSIPLIFRLEMGIPFSFHSLAWDRFFLKRGGFVFAIRGYFGIFAAF